MTLTCGSTGPVRADKIASCTGRGVTAPQQIAVPAQDGVRADQQHKVPELVHRQAVKQPSEEEPISPREHGLGRLPLQLDHHVVEGRFGLGGVPAGSCPALGGVVGAVAVGGVPQDGQAEADHAEWHGAFHREPGAVAGLADAEALAGVEEGDLTPPQMMPAKTNISLSRTLDLGRYSV
jgi:hypothetical protein